MRRTLLCSSLIVLAACAKPGDQAAAKDSTSASMAAGAAVTPIALADLAGKWSMKTMAATSDSVLLTFEIVAGADQSAWSFNFPGRDPIPARVLAVAGDSVVVEAGPYQSMLRKGVQVSTHSVMRLQEGKLVGTVVAHYATSGADSVVNLRTEGTRLQ